MRAHFEVEHIGWRGEATQARATATRTPCSTDRHAQTVHDLIDRYLDEHSINLAERDPLRAGLDQVGEMLRPKLRFIAEDRLPLVRLDATRSWEKNFFAGLGS